MLDLVPCGHSLGACSYPGCPEPAVILSGVHYVNPSTGQDVACPDLWCCPQHFYLLWMMADDSEFRQKILTGLNTADPIRKLPNER